MSGGRNLFVLGVGAQKAGTTWVHQYLKNSGRANMGMNKEYHIWDARFIESCKHFQVPRANRQGSVEKFARYAMQNFDGFYEQYFASLMFQDSTITGDITPAYCALQPAQLAEIRRRLERVGFVVKVVFSMRDPYERCWSATRMELRPLQKKINKNKAGGRTITERQANERFDRMYRTHTYQLRTRYEDTIRAIDQVFSPDEVHYGIYETMFRPEQVHALSEFLGVPPVTEFTKVVKNGSPSNFRIDSERKAACRAFYRSTYEFCHDRFPVTRTVWGPREAGEVAAG